MKTMQTYFDNAAVGLSLLCIAHCLLLPIMVSVIPVLAVLPLEDELYHKLLVSLVLPTSLIGLTLGCKKHKRWGVAVWGATGLLVIAFAAIFGHDVVGELGEKLLTVVGSMLTSWGHIRNYQLCRRGVCH